MSRTVAILAALSTVFLASTASAQPGMTAAGPTEVGPSEDTVPVMESYKRQIMISDGVAGGLLTVGMISALPCIAGSFDSDDGDGGACALMAVGFLGGIGTYAAVPAIIHLTKGNVSGAALSVVMRVGLPAAGLLLADNTDADIGSTVFLGGVAGALLVDWFVLAKRERQMSTRFVPNVATTPRGGVSFGVAGSF